MQTLNSFLLLGLLGGQKHSTGSAKIATGGAIAHPVNMLSETLHDMYAGYSISMQLRSYIKHGLAAALPYTTEAYQKLLRTVPCLIHSTHL